MLNRIHFPIVTRFKCIVDYRSNNIQLFVGVYFDAVSLMMYADIVSDVATRWH